MLHFAASRSGFKVLFGLLETVTNVPPDILECKGIYFSALCAALFHMVACESVVGCIAPDGDLS